MSYYRLLAATGRLNIMVQGVRSDCIVVLPVFAAGQALLETAWETNHTAADEAHMRRAVCSTDYVCQGSGW